MVRLDDGTETTFADLLGTIEGAKERTSANPLMIYNDGVAKMLVERGIVVAGTSGYLSGCEVSRAALEADIRALKYRRSRKGIG